MLHRVRYGARGNGGRDPHELCRRGTRGSGNLRTWGSVGSPSLGGPARRRRPTLPPHCDRLAILRRRPLVGRRLAVLAGNPRFRPGSVRSRAEPRARSRRWPLLWGCYRPWSRRDRKSTRLNSSHSSISYAVFCLKKKTTTPIANLFAKKNKKKKNQT